MNMNNNPNNQNNFNNNNVNVNDKFKNKDGNNNSDFNLLNRQNNNMNNQNNSRGPHESFYANNENKKMIVNFIKNDLIIYSDGLFQRSRLKENFFNDKNHIFQVYPGFGQFVVVNSSEFILYTGGTINKQMTDICYQIFVYKDSNNEFIQNISYYGSMNEKREKHNIIYLNDKNRVIVCGGVNNSTAEILDINERKWRMLKNLNVTRTNATMSYMNNRFVYVFGGFQNVRNKGVYNNDIEYLDMNATHNGWKYINFKNLFKDKINYCAMGVINLSATKIFLVGGYDGVKYLSTVHEIEIDNTDGKIVTYKNTSNKTETDNIFMHNSFERIEDSVFNFHNDGSLVAYNGIEGTFKCQT